ncbi:hypothetical protein GCM10009682_21550 [Luedemannella flava]|uniref:WD40 repeat protein n=1 Tax=Luedemannella flava TaxID=349316 RepID=A0ABP4Y3A3_9ACTN
MTDPDLATRFAAIETTDEPALPTGFAEQTLRRARRSQRRRRASGWAALALTVVAVLAVAPWQAWPQRPTPADQPDRPSLPAEFADLSRFTSHATDRPGGRAIALYEFGSSELFTTWQTLVAGADRDTYRRLDLPDNAAPPVSLSPDGRSVMFFEERTGTDEFTLLDLTTGRTSVRHSSAWASNVGASITMLAWSPDSRYLAYAVPAPSPNDGRAESSLRGGQPLRDVAILDVVTDTTVRYPANSPIFAAAFSPDGQRLAVQSDQNSPILSLRAEKVGEWLPPTGTADSALAWSPDGRLMAVQTNMGIRFVDMTGSGGTVPNSLRYDSSVLGWRSPTSIVVEGSDDDADTDTLVEVSVVDGHRTVLSRFPTTRSCEYGQHRCRPYRIQLATNLIADATIRPSAPDRGPWVPVVHAATTLGAGALGVALVLLILRRRRRRRAAR